MFWMKAWGGRWWEGKKKWRQRREGCKRLWELTWTEYTDIISTYFTQLRTS